MLAQPPTIQLFSIESYLSNAKIKWYLWSKFDQIISTPNLHPSCRPSSQPIQSIVQRIFIYTSAIVVNYVDSGPTPTCGASRRRSQDNQAFQVRQYPLCWIVLSRHYRDRLRLHETSCDPRSISAPLGGLSTRRARRREKVEEHMCKTGMNRHAQCGNSVIKEGEKDEDGF